jgi:hypothetical protein
MRAVVVMIVLAALGCSTRDTGGPRSGRDGGSGPGPDGGPAPLTPCFYDRDCSTNCCYPLTDFGTGDRACGDFATYCSDLITVEEICRDQAPVFCDAWASHGCPQPDCEARYFASCCEIRGPCARAVRGTRQDLARCLDDLALIDCDDSAPDSCIDLEIER